MPRTTDVSLGGEARGDRPKRQAERAQLTGPGDRSLLSHDGDETHAARVQDKAVRHGCPEHEDLYGEACARAQGVDERAKQG
ncbi:MAG: hypothetical protein ACLP1X_30640 [Polyangiaceae bacterium]